jgi:photosystem II stability/assembly factor-like uncharacterized protein
MATRTYTVGDQMTVRRLDGLVAPWIDVSINLLDCTGNPITGILRDVMTDPNDEDKVFAVGARNTALCNPGIFWSNDAGQTWNKSTGDILTPVGGNLTGTIFEIWAVDSNTIYATSDFGYCFKSTDGGVTFNHTVGNPEIVGFPAGNPEYQSRAVHFPDALNGAVGQTISFTHVSVTTNGGTTWLTTQVAATGSHIVGLHMSANGQVLNALNRDGVYRSTDGGGTWNLIYSTTADPTIILLHLTWTDDNNLWGYGTSGLRIRSTDGGATWNVINGPIVSGPSCKAGHHYQLPQGFFSEDLSILQTFDESVTGAISETPTTGIEAVWTHVGGPDDPPNPPPCGCPEGYTYVAATDSCEQVISIPPDCTNNILTVERAAVNQQYSQMGTNFFASTIGAALPLVNVGGTPWVPGIAPEYVGGAIFDANSIPLAYTNVNGSTNNFWGNCNPGNAYPFAICNGVSNQGRLNAVGVWPTLTGSPTGEWIGFTACINVPETGIYFIGIGSDESSRFSIDGVLFANLSPGSFDEWSTWRVFPVQLTAGQHVIEMEGFNNIGPGAFGAEIYKVPNDDVNVLMAVTSEIELAPYIIWNTLQVVGGVFDLGENSGCECPEGYALSNCNGFLECILTDTVPFLPCGCWLLTNCEDPNDTVLIQTDPLDPPLDLTKTYVFNSIDPDKCWTVSESDLCDPANPLPFSTFDETFDTCEDCLKICYELIDCEGLLTPRQTDFDLSAYVGQVITIASCPDTCWTVTELPDCPPVVVDIFLVDNFVDCATCLPAPTPEPPLVIRNRFVKPGYDTPGCPPEYVEKISCDWSEALFQEATSRRYGIKFCCNLDLDKLSIKKELLNLKMITDPDACKTIVEECCPPCNTTATIHVFQTIQCLAPEVTGVVLDVPPIPDPPCVDLILQANGHPGVIYFVTGTDCCGNAIDLGMTIGQTETLCIDFSQPYTVDPNIDFTIGNACDCDPQPPFNCFCIQPDTDDGLEGTASGNLCDGTPFDIIVIPTPIGQKNPNPTLCVRADGQAVASDNVTFVNNGDCTETESCEPTPDCLEYTFTNNSSDVNESAAFTLCTGLPRTIVLAPGQTSSPVCLLSGSITMGPNVVANPTGAFCA